MDLRICVLHRGWVLIGEYSRSGSYVTLKKPHVIRCWGTSRGLGEIALGGPNSGTTLDPEPEDEFHELQVIRTIKCNVENWGDYYGS